MKKYQLCTFLITIFMCHIASAECVYDPVSGGTGGIVSTTAPDVDCQVTLTAMPISGYTFLYWDDDHSNTDSVRVVSLTEYDDDDAHSCAWTAVFSKDINHCWDYTNYDPVRSAAGGVIVVEQDDVNYRYKLTARESSGYQFHHWSDLGYIDGTDSIRYITLDLDEDRPLYEAVFEKTISHCWDCSHYDPVTSDAHGSVSVTPGSGECEWIIEATPDEGYVFARWEDAATAIENPRTVTIDDLHVPEFTYTAVFIRPGDVSVDSWGTGNAIVTTVSRDLEDGTADIYKDGTRLSRSTLITDDRGIYTMPFAGVTSIAGDTVHIVYVNACNEICAVTDTIVPVIVAGMTNISELTLPTNIGKTDIHILNGGTLTFDASSTTSFAGLDIYAGGKAVVPVGKSVRTTSVTMRGDGINGRYPQLVANGTINNLNGDTVYYDYTLNYSAYYPLAVPYDVAHTSIRNRIGGVASFELGDYDGDTRATGASGWGGVFDDASSDIPSGEGFTVFAVPRKWNGTRQTKAVVRFPMVAHLTAGESTKNIPVYAYGDATTKDNDRNWNFIGNPYLADINKDVLSDEDMNINIGMFEKTLVDGVWYGDWHYSGDLRYVTIPADGFTSYTQEPVKTADLKAFNSYFVQASTDGYLTFELSRRAQEAPARRQTSGMFEGSVQSELSAGVVLTQGESEDHTGLLLGAAFTNGYDYNADLAKMYGSKQGLSVYSLVSAEPLAFVALPAEPTDEETPYREQTIALGYRHASLTDMTFAFDSKRYALNTSGEDRINAVLLHDNVTGEVTDLLQGSYTCRAVKSDDDTRFTLSVRYTYSGVEDNKQTGVATEVDIIKDNLTEGATTVMADGVYDIIGRRVSHAGTSAGLATGVYIIVENGKARKEVVR